MVIKTASKQVEGGLNNAETSLLRKIPGIDTVTHRDDACAFFCLWNSEYLKKISGH